MADPKLTASILDLSRNVDKLISELKKNTSTVQTLTETQADSPDVSEKLDEVAEKLAEVDLGSVKESLTSVSEEIKKLDFKDLSKKLGDLDFKNLNDSLKNLSGGEGVKGLAKKALGGEKIGDDIKSLVSGTFKDLKKGILGGFASGGKVSQSGSYVVGEKGPEVVKLNLGEKVVSNKDLQTQELVRMALEQQKEGQQSNKPSNQEVLSKLNPEVSKTGDKGPTAAQIEAQRKKLLAEDSSLAEDPDELEYEIKEFIKDFKRGKNATFTPEDIARLTKPVTPKVAQEVLPPAQSVQTETPTLAKKVEGGAETTSAAESITTPSGLGQAPEAAPDSKKKGGLKSTIQTILSKISPSSKMVSEVGELGKSTLPSGKLGAAGEEMINQLSSKLEGVLAPKGKGSEESKQPSESGTEEAGTTTATGTSSEETISKKDLDEMKAALFRIASLLEGPLSVAPLDYPFRPDSRRV